jgi:light-harvesting complex 1 beta chain
MGTEPSVTSTSGDALIFATGYLLIFLVALVAMSVGLDWRSWFPGSEGGKSMFGEVRSAVYTFMSHFN